MSEFVDLYDRNRKLLNRVVDRNTYLFQPGEFMMYVLAILENEEGKFWLHKGRWIKNGLLEAGKCLVVGLRVKSQA